MKATVKQLKLVQAAANEYYNYPEVIEREQIGASNISQEVFDKCNSLADHVVSKLAIDLGLFDMSVEKQDKLIDAFTFSFPERYADRTFEDRKMLSIVNSMFDKYSEVDKSHLPEATRLALS